MEIVLASKEGEGELMDFEMEAASVDRVSKSQRELFHSQVENLRRIVVRQCELTGVNPLSQEMAAGALSIKIGNRPRDLLNPKAIKYMQSVFSIKDTIGKKETREISALCGATITQVREFFAGQRSRVRKFVRLSREKAIMLDKPITAIINNGLININSDIVVSEHVPLNSFSNNVVKEYTKIQVMNDSCMAVQVEKQFTFPVENVNKKISEGSASCSLQDETMVGVDMEDKRFMDNIFSLMRKEETFEGQVKLIEWVLQINNPSVLCWFLTEGGVTILSTWLSQAATEEQTTVILVIFKVLCHLPFHKSLPSEMSAILQSVNKLRFYRASDISNKAKFLLSRWSKLLVRCQNGKRSSTETKKERFRKQRITEILSDESWQSRIDIPDDIFALGLDGSERCRELEIKPVLKLLPAPQDISSKNNRQIVSSNKTKQRRKVLLVEHPDCTAGARSVPVSRATSSNISRPLSADDIQKAKMRAIFMQDKYGKIDPTANKKSTAGTSSTKPPPASQRNEASTISKSYNLRVNKDKNNVSAMDCSQEVLETSIDFKPSGHSKDLLEKMMNDLIIWKMPPEVKINLQWGLCTGENSKELEVQTKRNRREIETIYLNVNDIPSNPKEPWDVEMDFDDSLTPEIPSDQLPDADVDAGDIADHSQSQLPPENMDKPQVPPTVTTIPPTAGNGMLGPDLELLAVLLKNPDLVFALTSGQGTAMDDAQTIALLDIVKNMGAANNETSLSVGENSSKQQQQQQELPATSLPSPTPPSERLMSGWRRQQESMPHFPASNVGVLHNVPQTLDTILSTQPSSTANLNLSAIQQTPDINILNRNRNISAAGISLLQHNFVDHEHNFAPPTTLAASAHRLDMLNTRPISNIPSFPTIPTTTTSVSGMRVDPMLVDPWSSRQHGLFDTSSNVVYQPHTSHNHFPMRHRRDEFDDEEIEMQFNRNESSSHLNWNTQLRGRWRDQGDDWRRR